MKQRTASRNHLVRLLLGLTLVVCMAIPSLSGPRNPRGRVGSADQSSSASLEKASLPSQVVAVGLNSVQLKKGAAVNGSVVVNDPSSSPVLNDPFDLSVESDAVLDGDATAASIEVKRNGEITGAVTSDNAVVANGGICDGCAAAADYVPPIFDPLPGFQSRPPGGSPLDVPSGIKTIPNATEPSRIYSNVTVGAGATLILTGGEFAFTSLSLAQNAKLLFASATQLHVNDLFDAGKESEIGPNPGSGISAKDIIIYVNGSGNPDDPNGLPYAVSIGTQSKAAANFYAPNGTFALQKTFQGVTSVLTGAVIAKNVLFDADTIVNVDSFFANQSPVAFPGDANTVNDAPVEITLTGSDPEGEDLTFGIEVDPVLGTLGPITPIITSVPEINRDTGLPTGNNVQLPITSATVTYTPDDPEDPKDEEDSFTFSVTDPAGAMGMAVVSINVPDVVVPDTPLSEVDAVDSPAATLQGRAVTVRLNAGATLIPDPSDPMDCPPPDGTGPCLPDVPLPLTFSIVAGSGPSNGTLGVVNQGPPGTVEYTPTGSFSGTDSFDFLVEGDVDGSGFIDQPSESDTATATITVDELAPDLNVSTFEDQALQIDLSSAAGLGGSGSPLGAAPTVLTKALSSRGAVIAGNVADANEDGFGDEKNALPGPAPGLISAGVNLSGGPGSNGTVRIHIEWDVSNIGSEFDVTSAQVTLNTHRGTIDSLDTVFSASILNGNGALDVSDFETFAQTEAVLAATMPVPSTDDMPIGSDGTFSFDVTAQLKEALREGFGFFTIQGRVVDELLLAGGTTPARGLEVFSSAAANLTANREPQLTVDTTFVLPVYSITSLPPNGTLRDSTGTLITAVPRLLADPAVTYTGNLGFFGGDSFSYEAAGDIVDTGLVIVTVAEVDCLTTVLGCDNGR